MKTKSLLLAALLATVALPALAQAPVAPTTDLAKLEGGTFAVDKNHARIIFAATHFGYSVYYGMFNDFDAKINFQPKDVTKSTLEVSVNLNGLTTDNPKMNDHLRTPDFFDVAKYPTAVFKSTGIQVTGTATGKITGDLTLHGVTKPITLDVTFNGGGTNPMSKAYVLGFNAVGKLHRSDFGIATFIPAVSDEVTLTISAEFDKQ